MTVASAGVSMKPVWNGCVPIDQPQPYKKALRKHQIWVEPLFARSAKTGMVCGFCHSSSFTITPKQAHMHLASL